jgi:hypothetical protein
MKSMTLCAGICAVLLTASSQVFAAGTKAANATHQSSTSTAAAPTAVHGPTNTGQPNASCEETPTTPGYAASAPGSAFNPSGHAGTVYAGEQTQNSRNPKSVSQYDVACTHQR